MDLANQSNRVTTHGVMPLFSIVTIADEITRAREHVLPGREAATTNELMGSAQRDQHYDNIMKDLVPFLPDSSGRDQRLDQHRFCPLGKLVVGNLDRIADVDDLGN